MMCCAALSAVILSSFMLAGCKQMVSATGAADYQKSLFFWGFVLKLPLVVSWLQAKLCLKIQIERKCFGQGSFV